ncbi:hypothetical protein GmHk_20G057920 [Glycine max]|nr:hypothetical protein GmHk_20G057920 [Glycine max]
MAEMKMKRNLPRQCQREDAATPPSTPTEDERSMRLEGHEEDQQRSRRRPTKVTKKTQPSFFKRKKKTNEGHQ